MMLNVFVFAVVGVMTYTWWKQGFFSAAIHLVLTVVSGVIAFGIWDLVVYKGLIGVMPENAWGIGLLAPFAVILLVFRTLADKLIPGNLQISPTGNMVGGGICGFISGVLIAGMLVIGMQMTGLPKLMGYTGWALSDQGEPARGLPAVDGTTAGALIIPVDTIAAGFFSNLIDGSMAPLSSARSFGQVHPDLDVVAAFYAQGEFAETRKAIRKSNLSIAEDGQAYYRSESVPEQMGAATTLRGDEDLVVVGSKVLIQPRESEGAADGDGIFRVKQPQVNLIYDDAAGGSKLVWPYGYIQNGEYVVIKADYIYSEVQSSVEHYWVFKVPRGSSPYGIQLKNTVALLPEAPKEGGVDSIGGLVKHQRSEEKGSFRVDKQASAEGEASAGGEGMEPDISEEASREIATVGEMLPFAMSVNQLGSKNVEFDLDSKTLIKGQAKITREKGVGRANGIVDFSRAKTARIIQVKLGANNPTSLLGKIVQIATSSTSAPVLRDDKGETHMPVGYMISSGAQVDFKFGLDDTIRTLKEINLGRTSATDDVRLLYHVAAPRRIISFDLGPNKQPLNLEVMERAY